MDISSIHFHDRQILRVTEDCAGDTLTMEVEYPVNWEGNMFERRLLIFDDVFGYQIFEGRFEGLPTILDATISAPAVDGAGFDWTQMGDTES